MSDLKQLRVRVKTVKSTQKITKAMQVVSATKFTKAKSLINHSEAYITILRKIMSKVSSGDNLQFMADEDKKFFLEDPSKPYLLIVFTSDRGLCGAFNFALCKQVKSDIAELQKAGKKLHLIIIGKKGYDIFKGQYLKNIVSQFELPKSNKIKLSLQVREKLVELIGESKIGACHVYFNRCKNAMTQIPTKMQILPVEKQIQSKEDYLSYEYEGEGLVHNMINLYVTANINYALLQSNASEEGARMTAMDNATKNAKELINKLTLKLNRSRQDLITKDLIEIIAGAEAI